jgi:hypothetical protein
MHFNIFTTCTSSGTSPAIPELDGKKLRPFDDHGSMGSYWRDAVQLATAEGKNVEAAHLYTGVSFRTAQKIVGMLQAEGHTTSLYIMSIGFGLIHPEDKIVPYNLSLLYDKSPDSASMYRLIREPLNAELWWTVINRNLDKSATPISDVMLTAEADTFNLVVVSNSFFSMVAGDIYNALQEKPNLRLAIFGPTNHLQLVRSARKLAQHEKVFALDRDKLNNKIPGNRLDAPQRAGVFLTQQMLKEGINKEPAELLQDLLGASSQKPKRDISEVIQELRTEGLEKEEVHKQLLEKGYLLSSKAFSLAWDPNEVAKVLESNSQDAAISALKGIGFVTPENDDESIELLVVFRDALIAAGHAGGMFGARELSLWGKAYCENVGRTLPGKFQSPQKLTYLLKQVGPSLRIYPANNPKVQTASFQVVA